MPIKPAGRFVLDVEETRETMRFFGKMSRYADEFERKGLKYYLILGADLPAWGYQCKSLQKYLIEATQEGWFFYGGIHRELIESILRFEKKFSHLEFAPEDVIPTPGCGGAWNIIHRTLLEPGDEIVTIVPCHYLSMMARVARYLGAEVKLSPSIEEENWEPDIEALREKVTDKTKFIEIDHPNNPTGQIYSEKARKAIIDIAGEYDIPVMSDEMYEFITFDGKEAPSMATLTDDVPIIVFRSFSKIFMAPGARFGWLSFHDPQGKIAEFKKACRNPANAILGNSAIPLPMRVAAMRLMNACVDIPVRFRGDQLGDLDAMSELKNMNLSLQAARDYTDKRINEIDGIDWVKPVCTLYGVPRIDGIGSIWKTDEDFLFGLMEEEQVAFNKAARFGAPGHFRHLLMANPLEDIFDRLERFINRHSK